MSYSTIARHKGISLIEVIFAIAIAGVLVAISVSVFSSLSNSQSLDRDVQNVHSQIEKARTMAINSVDGVEHGVKFDDASSPNKVEVFSGAAYDADNVESHYDIPAKFTISDISLSGGGDELYFNKLTGNASKSGTITISPVAGGAGKTIEIYATGISEIQ